MARMTGNEIETVNRRMASVSRHLIIIEDQSRAPVALSNCSSRSSSKSNDSYQRVHGGVPTHPPLWKKCGDFGEEFTDITYEKAAGEGIAKITINRPERRNALRPKTVNEMMKAFSDAREDNSIGVIILTGKGTQAFCSGGDQSLRGKTGYADEHNIDRFNMIDLQVQIRRLPKPVIAMVAGYAIGGGQVLHMICDITIAADNAVFAHPEAKIGNFDAGYGCSIMDRLIGPKKAREIWFMGRFYNAAEAEKMGLVNVVVPVEKLEEETMKWSREMMRNSPMAIRILKSGLNAVDDGHSGLQQIAGDGALLFYGTEEGSEGRNAYLERRKPDFSRFPRLP